MAANRDKALDYNLKNVNWNEANDFYIIDNTFIDL